MKANFNYSQRNNGINNNLLMRKHKLATEHKYKADITRENKELNRPARAISFGGSAGLTKAINKGWHGLIEGAYNNEVVFNSFYALLVAGILKPMAVLNMPGSEDKDKQIVATKNFLQAFIGSLLSFTIGGKIVNKAVETINIDLDLIEDVIKQENGKKIVKTIDPGSKKALKIAKEALLSKNKKVKNYSPTIDQIRDKAIEIIKDFEDHRKEHFDKNPDFVKLLKDDKATVEPSRLKKFLISKTENLPEMFQVKASKQTINDGYRTLWKRSSEFFTALGKAKISTILLPSVMALLFTKKNLEKQMLEESKRNNLAKNKTLANNQEKIREMMNKSNQQISFKGGLNSMLTSGIECIGNTEIGAKLAKFIASFNKPSARMGDFESFAITAYWLQNTARSKKIEPSQKLGLNVHSALVTIVSSTASFIIDWSLDFIIDKSKEKYKKALGQVVDEIKDKKPGKTIEKVFEEYGNNLTPIHKMGITDEIRKALSLLKENKTNVSEIIRNIQSTDSCKNAILSETLINDIIEASKQTEAFEESIKKSCEHLLNSKKIAEVLSKIDLNNTEAVDIAKKSLTGQYGKICSKFKSLTIFTLVVRFLVPVLMVPFSGKLKKKIIEWTDGKPNTPKTQKA
ncbi:MAG: hypothetical protein IKU37_08285 [Candidatus Gastranaerophilales bacterium]|nr:hypothetical protein [Candidatus Gastranaerophilales bacterium]